ncbi:hypothetical protein CASFOL_019966 [Castilleja foliolosa]|uniref:KIB1-4 beta-propeller domain-containing protein n=1 Tax=Castilleja foliolosa TaxID=1961234 RepID=A0ABD3D284_9LAMI
MGEKKMIKKERKSPSKKKVEPPAVVPSKTRISWFYYNSSKNYTYHTSTSINESRSGGITKSWISSRCTHHTWPQLAETNISRQVIKIRFWERNFDHIPLQMSIGGRSGFHENRMVITGISSPAFAFYSNKGYTLADYSWRTSDCRITEPYSGDNRYMEFTNMIAFQGIYYVISRQGSLAVIELDGDSGNYAITALGRGRVVPNCRVSKHFREYLLEYKGEIYVVFLLSRVSIKVVDDVEVFRLDKSRLLLEKVDRLVGDAMFMVGDICCKGISTGLLECSKRSNCVYFTHDRANDTWFVYDMKSGCISTTPLPPEIDL